MCSTCYNGMLIEKCACDFSFAETKYLPKANLERKSLFLFTVSGFNILSQWGRHGFSRAGSFRRVRRLVTWHLVRKQGEGNVGTTSFLL